jgi:hypothetical protein
MWILTSTVVRFFGDVEGGFERFFSISTCCEVTMGTMPATQAGRRRGKGIHFPQNPTRFRRFDDVVKRTA